MNREKASLAMNDHRPLLSVLVPVYNEAQVLTEFHARLRRVLNESSESFEIIYINDGSKDDSLQLIKYIRDDDESVSYIDLSRNFGKEIAMTAGLDHCRGDAVVLIDADLQDPPELIPAFLEKWRDGYDNVYATRRRREGETALKRATASLFYRVIGSLSHTEIPANTGDFRLLSRRAVDSLNKLRESHRFMKGLYAWIGYPSISVEYDRDPRFAGQTKFNYWKLWNFAIEGITSFSVAPLKISSYFGGAVAFLAGISGCVIIGKTIFYGEQVHGYPSLMCSILFLGGVQLMAIGVLGEYVGRMFNQTKGRPLYLVNEYGPGLISEVMIKE